MSSETRGYAVAKSPQADVLEVNQSPATNLFINITKLSLNLSAGILSATLQRDSTALKKKRFQNQSKGKIFFFFE